MATQPKADGRSIALRCEVEWLPVLAAAPGPDAPTGPRRKNRPFRMTAYTGGIAEVDYYGRVVFDLATLDVGAAARIPALVNHDRDRIAGFIEKREIKKGADGLPMLECAGEAFAGMPDADQVIEAAERGFPWGSSVWLRPGTAEYVEAGVDVDVNERKLAGPFLLFKNCTQREASFVTLGGDPEASAELAASQGAPMTTPATPPAAPTPAPATTPPPAPPVVPATREEFVAILAESPTHGQLVADLFAKGEGLVAIRAAVGKKISEQLAAKDAEIGQLKAKLAQPGVGFNGAAREGGDPRAAAATGAPPAGEDLKARAEKVWNKTPELQAEYGHTFDWFLADVRRTGLVEE